MAFLLGEFKKVCTFAVVFERASRTSFLIGVWCNGNTADSGPAFPGSSPGTPTPEATMNYRCLFSISVLFKHHHTNIHYEFRNLVGRRNGLFHFWPFRRIGRGGFRKSCRTIVFRTFAFSRQRQFLGNGGWTTPLFGSRTAQRLSIFTLSTGGLHRPG